MDHTDHVNLIKDGIPERGGIWADLGSGAGAFTLALAEVIGPEGVIYSVDTNKRRLQSQQGTMESWFPQNTVQYLNQDISKPLELPQLDGIVMANSLHFFAQKEPILELVHGYLKPFGRLIVVEYNVDKGNRWVPYPFSYEGWEKLAQATGFIETRLLMTRHSRFLDGIYSAVSLRDRT